jgi:hypothetical protein
VLVNFYIVAELIEGKQMRLLQGFPYKVKKQYLCKMSMTELRMLMVVAM